MVVGATSRFQRSILIFACCALNSLAYAQFVVEIFDTAHSEPRVPVEKCEATGADFGPDVAAFSFHHEATGCATGVHPDIACSNNVTFNRDETHCDINFAVVPRGNCSFSEKAYFVQNSKPSKLNALIVYNNEGEGPIPMARGPYADSVEIPVVMVSYNCMSAILEHPPSKGYVVQIKLAPGYYDLFRYLIPFVVVVGFCFVVLLVSLAIRLCRERRKIARKRLSKRNLKKIPTKKFRKGEEPDTCAICLEEFIDGEKLRVLPCRHVYHCKCIDPWLTQNRKVCPMCKRRVGARNSDSEESDRETQSSNTRTTATSLPSTSQASLNTVTFVEDELERRMEREAMASTSRAAPDVASLDSQMLHADVHAEELQQQNYAEVHNHDVREMSGSREQLVDLSNDESDNNQEADNTLSQSLKKKLKGFFKRSSRSPDMTTNNEVDDHETGVVNNAFDNASTRSSGSEGSKRRDSRVEPTAYSEGEGDGEDNHPTTSETRRQRRKSRRARNSSCRSHSLEPRGE